MKKTYFVSAWLPSYTASEPGCNNACIINCPEVTTLEGAKKLEEACVEIFSNSAAVLTCWKLLENSDKNNVEGKTFDYDLLFPQQEIAEDEGSWDGRV